MFRLEPRPAPAKIYVWLAPLLALLLTLLCAALLFAALGKNPLEGLRVFFINPLASGYHLAELLLKATPLLLCALGLAIGYQANVWNIGAEGQFIMGALAASLFALYFAGQTGAWLLPGMALAGIFGGALWAALPAWLASRFQANEVLTSLMLVYVAQLLVSWLVFGVLKDPQGMNFPQTRSFAPEFMLPLLTQGTRLNLALPLALLFALMVWLFMRYSYTGFKLRVAGQAPAAARFAGFSSVHTLWLGMLVGGGCAGLAGMTEVAGPLGQLTDKVGSGYGFAAIIVAFVGRLSPLGICFASLLMALFYLGGEQAQQNLNLPATLAKLLQGLLLFWLLGMDVLINYRLRWRGSGQSAGWLSRSSRWRCGAQRLAPEENRKTLRTTPLRSPGDKVAE